MSAPVIISLIAGGILLIVGVAFVLGRRAEQEGLTRMCAGCHRGMMPDWSTCMFCGWSPASRLEFMSGPYAGQVVVLSQEVTTIGSVAGNTVLAHRTEERGIGE